MRALARRMTRRNETTLIRAGRGPADKHMRRLVRPHHTRGGGGWAFLHGAALSRDRAHRGAVGLAHGHAPDGAAERDGVQRQPAERVEDRQLRSAKAAGEKGGGRGAEGGGDDYERENRWREVWVDNGRKSGRRREGRRMEMKGGREDGHEKGGEDEMEVIAMRRRRRERVGGEGKQGARKGEANGGREGGRRETAVRASVETAVADTLSYIHARVLVAIYES
eukprot:3277446-Pleurochrysis_carterae.AAC.3